MDGNTVHFIAGATGGTAGAVLTCPLEVLKTRLQSSKKSLLTDRRMPYHEIPRQLERHNAFQASLMSSPTLRVRMGAMFGRFFITLRDSPRGALVTEGAGYSTSPYRQRIGIISCLRNIIVSEGPGSLFKGLLPNLVGVAPSRAIYFAAYAQGKAQLNNCGLFHPDTPIIHIFAAAFAGFSAATCTNPIWVVKTRMQLNQNSVSTFQCTRSIYMQGGLRSFYKGVTASYYGLTETIIHLVIYEEIKRFIAATRNSLDTSQSFKNFDDDNFDDEVKDSKKSNTGDVGVIRWFMEYMGAGAMSKTVATCIAYPHEVARTRLREENSRYKTFWQTLSQVVKEEGTRGLYRGLGVQLVRQIPNTAVVMATYEAMVYLLSSKTIDGTDPKLD